MRSYAPFFEWFDKGQKELGVVEDLIRSLNANGEAGLRSPQLYRPDPPDCVCVNAKDQSVAIEVVEAVCEDAARLTAQGDFVMRRWRDGEFRAHVGNCSTRRTEKSITADRTRK
jgi:hypothetical protein